MADHVKIRPETGDSDASVERVLNSLITSKDIPSVKDVLLELSALDKDSRAKLEEKLAHVSTFTATEHWSRVFSRALQGYVGSDKPDSDDALFLIKLIIRELVFLADPHLSSPEREAVHNSLITPYLYYYTAWMELQDDAQKKKSVSEFIAKIDEHITRISAEFGLVNSQPLTQDKVMGLHYLKILTLSNPDAGPAGAIAALKQIKTPNGESYHDKVVKSRLGALSLFGSGLSTVAEFLSQYETESTVVAAPLKTLSNSS